MDKKESTAGNSLTRKIRLTSFTPSSSENGLETSYSSIQSEDSVFLPFEDSFTRGRYAGSYKLRFGGDTVRLPKQPKKQTAFATKEARSIEFKPRSTSSEFVDIPSGTYAVETESEVQEDSIKFVELKAASDVCLLEDGFEKFETNTAEPPASKSKPSPRGSGGEDSLILSSGHSGIDSKSNSGNANNFDLPVPTFDVVKSESNNSTTNGSQEAKHLHNQEHNIMGKPDSEEKHIPQKTSALLTKGDHERSAGKDNLVRVTAVHVVSEMQSDSPTDDKQDAEIPLEIIKPGNGNWDMVNGPPLQEAISEGEIDSPRVPKSQMNGQKSNEFVFENHGAEGSSNVSRPETKSDETKDSNNVQREHSASETLRSDSPPGNTQDAEIPLEPFEPSGSRNGDVMNEPLLGKEIIEESEEVIDFPSVPKSQTNGHVSHGATFENHSAEGRSDGSESEVESVKNDDSTAAHAASEMLRSNSPTINTQDVEIPLETIEPWNGSGDMENEPLVGEAISDEEDQVIEFPHVPQNEMNGHGSHANAISHSTDSEVGSEPESNSDENEGFHFYPPEDEPVLKPNIKKRVERSVTSVIEDFEGLEEEMSPSAVKQCCSCCVGCCQYDLSKSKGSHNEHAFYNPEIKYASSQGFKMLRKFFHPTLPKLLSDVWVLAELAVTVTQFVLSITVLSLNEGNRPFNYTYLVLASLGLTLALLDSFVYFVQLGSCAYLFRYCRKKLSKKQTAKDPEENRKGCCQFLSKETQKKISELFDVVRTVISELIIYPLVILDLFDLIVSGSLLRTTHSDRLNFGLFIIGALFLVLSMYVIRAFMVISATVNFKRIPTARPSKSYQSMVITITQFCIHVLAQLLVHICIVIIIALKIFQENPDPSANTTNASPFLVYSAIAGGIIPLYGVAMFFITNYYQLQELSIGVWVDMVSLLQSESFAELVFQGRGLKVSRQKAKRFFEKMKVQEVKKQLKGIQSASTWIKAFYPFRFPVLVVIGVVYELLLISFIVTLMFSSETLNGVNQITFVLFQSDLSTGFFILLVFIILANLHVLLLVSAWIVLVIGFLVAVPLLFIVYAVFYIFATPILICGACFYPCAKELDLLDSPIAHVSELRRRVTTIGRR